MLTDPGVKVYLICSRRKPFGLPAAGIKLERVLEKGEGDECNESHSR